MRTDLIPEAGEPGSRVANCKVIEQDPDSVVAPHFHYVNQFQVVTSGGGSIGRKAVKPLSVHFTGPHTSYGPIRADGDGLTYVVMRDQVDSGAEWMPESRARMSRAISRRHQFPDPVEPAGAGALAALSSSEIRPLIPAQEDGLSVFLLSLPGGATQPCPDPGLGGGQFFLVTAGQLIHCDRVLDAGSCIHVGPDEEPLSPHADSGGAEVLVLQFPR